MRSEIFDEKDIPAEYEEEIVADEGFENFESQTDSVEETMPLYALHPRSLLKPQTEIKFKQTLTVSRSILKANHRLPVSKCKSVSNPISSSTFHNVQNTSKFRQTVNLTKPSNFILNEHTMKIFKKKIKAQAMARERNKRIKKIKTVKLTTQNFTNLKKNQEKKIVALENFIYIGPQKPKIVDPKNSGEIVRVQKSESDVEVDVLSNSEEDVYEMPLNESFNDSMSAEDICVNAYFNDFDLDNELEKKINEMQETDRPTYETLMSIEIPEIELTLENSNVTNLERFFHSEFFGKLSPSKTPERYLF